ncbi:MAG TPA: glycerol acyltransferase [Gammaproteobacteria bacterium]|nr:MAG: glycerol acyltransferase [Gammaproteobacteria bacterium TMED163]HAR91093.1 glycerol acyltransferase [Gammaproteobacteria bacterium]HAU24400.1 glycerol acyltransferase [Gammaproteobacteria bacterium]HCI87736.1 glycerol acyltransferase [Gammaproteobacteria bacterium]|tara:strand:- start:2041 stop:2616 length:576 start_codon:yes stop_codon:yes gene_type:complete
MRTTVFSTPLLTPVLRGLALLILVLIGWSTRGEPLAHQRCVLIGAPHTSNWDFPLMLLVVLKLKLRLFWMGKHTLFPFPFGWLMKWLGGIPINRSASHNVVNETVRQYAENDQLIILIPPEGTRSKVTRWKTGFYHIANNAEVPILLGYVDASKKEAGFADFFTPTGDLEKDMVEIRAFYANKRGLLAKNS